MNRRGILALLGGAVAMPGTVGAKTAAAIMGIDPHSPAPMPLAQRVEHGCSEKIADPFWGSPTQIAFDAAREARYEVAQHDRYAHMKSWGQGFRHSVTTREKQIEQMFLNKCRDDKEFFAKIIEALK